MPGPGRGRSRCAYQLCTHKVNWNTLHKFPFENQDLLKQWIANMRGKYWRITPQSTLCSAHFDVSCFNQEAQIKADAIPTVFCLSEKVNNIVTRKKSKHVTQTIQFYKNFIGKTEKECNKCGFASFSLHVLYVHKYKCQGKLIGMPLICCFCMRKFNYFNAYHRHKLTCVCSHNKKKYWQVKYFEKKLSKKRISKSLVCVHCKKDFSNEAKYKLHVAKEMCCIKRKNKDKYLNKRNSFSARKTFSNSKYDIDDDSVNFYSEDEIEDVTFKDNSVYLGNMEKTLKNTFQCTYCKSLYSTKKFLFEHLEKNFVCAKVFYLQHSMKKMEHSARKSMPIVAKKSFSKSKSNLLSLNRGFYEGSARKSMHHLANVNKSRVFSCVICKGQFPSSVDFNLHKVYCPQKVPYSSSCPVCLQKFSNSFDLFHHQKIDNHWGKATKSMALLCKCPFCDRVFSNVASRNSHLNSHSDQCHSVKLFLNDTTCEICSNCFATKTSKIQHMQIEHSSQSVKLRKSLCDVADWNEENHKNSSNENVQTSFDQSKMFKGVSFSESIKQKMRKYPTRCPVCMNSFSKIYNRNRHILSHVLECKICGLKCTKSDLKHHFQQYHRKQYEFQCMKCKKQFKTKSHGLTHASRVHPNLSSKDIILRQVGNHYNSEINMKNDEFYCDICEMSFAKFYGLQRHRQSKFHRNTLTKNLDAVHESLSTLPLSTSPALDELIKQPEILSCSECAEEFTSMIDFVPHRLSHFSSQASQSEFNELKPYICEICNKMFDTNQRVQFHLFEHLQSQTSTENNTNNESVVSKTEPIIPDRLSGQHIAKKSFSKTDKSCNQEVVIEGVKKSLFTCDACNIGFMSKYHYTCHVRRFCKVRKSSSVNDAAVKDDNSILKKPSIQKNKIIQDSDDYIDSDSNYIIFDKCVLCKMCYCIFADCDLFQKHCNSYCKKCFYDNELLNNENTIFALKSVIEHDNKSCGCVRCCLPFESLRSLREHMNTHKTDMTCDSSMHIKDDTKEQIESSTKSNDSNSALIKENNKSLECVELTKSELSENSAVKTENNYSLKTNSLPSEKSITTFTETQNSPDASSEKVLETLRKNFSQLLYILISDPELMEQLGYGEKIIDDVLANVLNQMGQTPFHDESSNSELDNLRKNIQILLDICLKENVMEIIADGQTSLDNIVIEALKMLSSEEESLSPSKESQSKVLLSPSKDSPSKTSLSLSSSKVPLSPKESPFPTSESPSEEPLSPTTESPSREPLSPTTESPSAEPLSPTTESPSGEPLSPATESPSGELPSPTTESPSGELPSPVTESPSGEPLSPATESPSGEPPSPSKELSSSSEA